MFVCVIWLSVHMKSVVKQVFFHEFTFDNKALKTFIELRIRGNLSNWNSNLVTSLMLVYRGGSNFDAEVLLLVRELKYERPRKLIDTYVITVDKQPTAADAHTNVYQLGVLQYNTYTCYYYYKCFC